MSEEKVRQEALLAAIRNAERFLDLAKGLAEGQKDLDLELLEVDKLIGAIGTFDGEFLITMDGRKYQIPPNYASKSLLVPGDTLRMIETGEGEHKFKQIRKIERIPVEGVLTKKNGNWSVVTEDGSFKLLAASVKFHEGNIGEAVQVLLPKDYKKRKCEWATLEEIRRGEEVAVVEEARKEPEAKPAPPTPSPPPRAKKVAAKAVAAKKKVARAKPHTEEAKAAEPKAEKVVKGEIVITDDELR